MDIRNDYGSKSKSGLGISEFAYSIYSGQAQNASGLAPEDYEDTLTYRANGAGEISGWQIHLALTPRQEHLQMGEEAASVQEAKTLHLFYENGN